MVTRRMRLLAYSAKRFFSSITELESLLPLRLPGYRAYELRLPRRRLRKSIRSTPGNWPLKARINDT
jgi:hypothetical protein